MDTEIKAKWLAALRGGEYQQIREHLRSDDPDAPGMCCLGVLCDVIDPDRWTDEEYMGDLGDGREGEFYEEPPPDIRERAGFTGEQLAELVHMNDGLKEWKGNPQTFRQIADYIDANL